jgi:hypothetical protein
MTDSLSLATSCTKGVEVSPLSVLLLFFLVKNGPVETLHSRIQFNPIDQKIRDLQYNSLLAAHLKGKKGTKETPENVHTSLQDAESVNELGECMHTIACPSACSKYKPIPGFLVSTQAVICGACQTKHMQIV